MGGAPPMYLLEHQWLYIFSYISFLLRIKLSDHSLSGSTTLYDSSAQYCTLKTVVYISHCGAAAALSRHGHQNTGEDIHVIILTSHDYIVCHITMGGEG
jgi:hypothetical protein